MAGLNDLKGLSGLHRKAVESYVRQVSKANEYWFPEGVLSL